MKCPPCNQDCNQGRDCPVGKPNMKEKALKLAENLDKASEYLRCIGDANFKECADMIRKLVAELDKAEPAILDALNSGKGVGYVDGMRAMKREALHDFNTLTLDTGEKRSLKPLSDEEINQLWAESHEDSIAIKKGFTTQQHYFARLIEERHGIK